MYATYYQQYYGNYYDANAAYYAQQGYQYPPEYEAYPEPEQLVQQLPQDNNMEELMRKNPEVCQWSASKPSRNWTNPDVY